MTSLQPPHSILDLESLGSWRWDVENDQVTWSPALYKIFGLQPGETPPPWAEHPRIYTPESFAALEFAVKECLNTGQSYSLPLTALHSSGKAIFLEGHGAAERDASGKITHLYGITLDRTREKTIEREAFEVSQRLKALMDALPVGVSFSKDISCREIYGNPAILSQFGASKPDNLSASALAPDSFGRKIRYFQNGEELADHELPLQRAVREEREIEAEEIEVLMPNGRRWVMEASAAPIRDQNGNVVAGVSVNWDITERKRTMERLDAALAAAESANRAKEHFLAILSHELRTPLTPVLMLAASMERSKTLDPSLKRDFAMIRSNIEQEAKLIDDLLDLTRILQGKFQLELQRCNLNELLAQSIQTFHADAQSKKISLSQTLPLEPAWAECDPYRMKQVFGNVLKNAIKFTPSGGSVCIESEIQDQHVKISIADSGMGIEKSDLKRIFQAFEQSGDGNKPHFGGLGLGLSISSLLIRQHGGLIWAESEGIGKGATIYVQLPLAHSIATPKPASLSNESSSNASLRLRLLLVEDHEDSRNVLVSLLSGRGHHVVEAGSAAEALKVAESGSFDLAICDLGLPDSDGHTLIRQLGVRHGLRGIALTGYGMEQDLARSRQAGFLAHVIKPVDIALLENALLEAWTLVQVPPGSDWKRLGDGPTPG